MVPRALVGYYTTTLENCAEVIDICESLLKKDLKLKADLPF